jgi:hypothetical protein
MKYVRTGTTTRDKALTDIGLFQLATEGIPFPSSSKVGDTLVIGELWATYTVKVSRANLYSSLLAYNVLTFQQRCNVLANPLTVTTYSDPTQAGSMPPPATVSFVNAPSNNYGITAQLFQGLHDYMIAPNIQLPPCIVLTWPQNTILGTFMIEIDCHITQPTDDIDRRYLQLDTARSVSVKGITPTATTNRYQNSANLITQWGCPFDPSNFTSTGLVVPPSIDITGLPLQAPSGSIWDQTGPSAGNWTIAGLASLGTGSYLQNDTSTLTPFQGFTIKCGFSINAPGLNTAQLVFTFKQSPAFVTTDLFRIRVTSTNSSITQTYPGGAPS